MVQPCWFPVLQLNWLVFKFPRFLSYFWFLAITRPDWRPVPNWTGWTGQSGPGFKTMVIGYKIYVEVIAYWLFCRSQRSDDFFLRSLITLRIMCLFYLFKDSIEFQCITFDLLYFLFEKKKKILVEFTRSNKYMFMK